MELMKSVLWRPVRHCHMTSKMEPGGGSGSGSPPFCSDMLSSSLGEVSTPIPYFYPQENKGVPIMRRSLMGLILGLLIPLAPGLTFAQSGTAMQFGGTTFYSFNGITGTGQQLGNMEYYNFSNGQSATRQHFGNMDYYSSPSPSLSGTVQTFGTQAYGNWNDGTRSMQQRFGNTEYDSLQRGNQTIRCTSQQFGSRTFTNCQ